MLPDRLITPFRVVVLSLAASPAFFLAAFYDYVLAARLYLGYWPQYNRPDPKWLGWWMPHNSLWLGLMCLPYVLVLAGCLMVVGRCRSKDFPVLTTILICGASFGLFMGCLSIDPGGFFDCFFD